MNLPLHQTAEGEEIERLRARLEAAEASNTAAYGEMADLRASLEAAHSAAQFHEASAQDANRQLNEMRAERDALLDMNGRQAQTIVSMRREIDSPVPAALPRFNAAIGTDDCGPLERLRFFLSLALSPQDWIDVEPFLDALPAAQPAAVPDELPEWAVSVTVRWGGRQCERWVSEVAACTINGVELAGKECWSVITADGKGGSE